MEPVPCTRSLLLGILGVYSVGNTAFRTFVPLMYCTTHLDGRVPNEGSTSEIVSRHEASSGNFV
eukprot:2763949-Pyramimonas_sp.AAC.1